MISRPTALRPTGKAPKKLYRLRKAVIMPRTAPESVTWDLVIQSAIFPHPFIHWIRPICLKSGLGFAGPLDFQTNQPYFIHIRQEDIL